MLQISNLGLEWGGGQKLHIESQIYESQTLVGGPKTLGQIPKLMASLIQSYNYTSIQLNNGSSKQNASKSWTT